MYLDIGVLSTGSRHVYGTPQISIWSVGLPPFPSLQWRGWWSLGFNCLCTWWANDNLRQLNESTPAINIWLATTEALFGRWRCQSVVMTCPRYLELLQRGRGVGSPSSQLNLPQCLVAPCHSKFRWRPQLLWGFEQPENVYKRWRKGQKSSYQEGAKKQASTQMCLCCVCVCTLVCGASAICNSKSQ